MKTLSLPKKLPAALVLGSFFGLLFLLLGTNPLSNSAVIAIFFSLLLIFLLGLSRLAVSKGYLGPQSAKVSVTLSVGAVALLMLKSTQSLGFWEGIILILIGVGLFFYLSRKS